MLRRIALVLAGLLSAGTLTFVGAIPASAVTDQICDRINVNNTPAGECFNAWNGGPYVKSYTPNVGNDNFFWQFVEGRCQAGSSLTTANCPISGVPAGLEIFQIRYVNNPGNCVGDLNGASGDAHASAFDACNDPNTGFGGSYGTIFVQASCTNNFSAFVSAHWSSSWGSGARFIGYTPSGSNGQQFWLNLPGSSGQSVCWIVF